MRTVNFTWKDHAPPGDLFRAWWRETWCQSGWNARLWTDADIQKFFEREFPLFASHQSQHPVMRSDAFRYLLLKRFGGLYVDLDFVNLSTLDWLEEISSFACGEQEAGILCNAFLWAPKAEDPFFDGIEEALELSSGQENPIDATGPRFLTRYAEGRSMVRLHEGMLYPLAWDDDEGINELRSLDLAEMRKKYPAAKAIHLWSRSWFPEGYSTGQIKGRD